MKTQCKSAARCRKCANSHEEKECNENINYYCALCGDNHAADSKECVMFKKNKNIKEIMAMQNIPYNEAKEIVFNKKNSRFADSLKVNTNSLEGDRHFPKLGRDITKNTAKYINGSNMEDKKARNEEYKEGNRFEIISGLKDKQKEYDEEVISKIYKPKNTIMKIEKRNIRRNINRYKNKEITDPNDTDVSEFTINKVNKEEEKRICDLKIQLKEMIKSFRLKIYSKENLNKEEIVENLEKEIDFICNSNAIEEPLLAHVNDIKKKGDKDALRFQYEKEFSSIKR
uniref:Putative e3 ubiquitin ligase n=1 Tax=Xenopsylla cheopis TaxID=163159 RepID=A0A6M2DQG3_XENCH